MHKTKKTPREGRFLSLLFDLSQQIKECLLLNLLITFDIQFIRDAIGAEFDDMV